MLHLCILGQVNKSSFFLSIYVDLCYVIPPSKVLSDDFEPEEKALESHFLG